MPTEEIKESAEQYLMDTYTRQPISIVRGRGAKVYDSEGREYVDFVAGIAVNLRHQFFAARAVMGDMREAGGGSIVNFGSVSWMCKQGGMPVYTTSKSAVQGLTRSLARDLGPFHIRVNTLVPGWVMTERQLRLWATDEARAEVLAEQCIPRLLQPEDIARMALFLAADDSAMCTAQDFIVDGGWT